MKIQIKTATKPLRDPDIRALYLLDYALSTSTDAMRIPNLVFVLAKYGLRVYRCEQSTTAETSNQNER